MQVLVIGWKYIFELQQSLLFQFYNIVNRSSEINF